MKIAALNAGNIALSAPASQRRRSKFARFFFNLDNTAPVSLRSILFRCAWRPNVVFVIPDRDLDFQHSGLGAVIE